MTVQDETGGALPVLGRDECDRISAVAAADTAARLAVEAGVNGPDLPTDDLKRIMLGISTARPLTSSMALAKLRRQLGQPNPTQRMVASAWQASSLMDFLAMLVEHSVLWVPLRGRPGERRIIAVSQQVSVAKRSILRWSFGELSEPRLPLLHPLRSRRARNPAPDSVLRLGESAFGRRAYLVSFPAIWERIGQRLALMPLELEIPTVHARRGPDYEFALTCPPGLTPRAIRLFTAGAKDVAPHSGKQDNRDGTEGASTALAAGVAQARLVGGPTTNDLWLRVTVGLSARPIHAFWWLICALPAALLWTFAGAQPHLTESKKSIVGAVFVAGFSFLATQAAKAWSAEQPVPGAALALLLSALSLAAGTFVLIGARPLGLETGWAWSACATCATVASVLLLAAWLLTLDDLWSLLRKFKTAKGRRWAERIAMGLAASAVAALLIVEPTPAVRGAIAMFLLAIAVAMTVLASNRVDTDSDSRAVGLAIASATSVVLGCVELKGAVVHPGTPQGWIELSGLGILLAAQFCGSVLSLLATRFHPAPDEIVVTPDVGRALLAKERLRELQALRGRGFWR